MSQRRVIALLDMDCFYAQIEQRDNPHLWDKPTAVVSAGASAQSRFFTVSYEARRMGVKKMDTIEHALEMCPDLNLVEFVGGTMLRYRNASREIFSVLSKYDKVKVERASIDEAYLDLTEAVKYEIDNEDNCKWDDVTLYRTTNAIGPSPPICITAEKREQFLDDFLIKCRNDTYAKQLAIGAMIVEKIRQDIRQETQFFCSAGIAETKTVAKLACGLHKPRQQTVVAPWSIAALWRETNITSIRGLGGKLGSLICESFTVEKMCDLENISAKLLIDMCGEKTGTWLHKLLRDGTDDEAVTSRQINQSIGASKILTGDQTVKTKSDAYEWVRVLSKDLMDKLNEDLEINNRRATNLTITVKLRLESWKTTADTNNRQSVHSKSTKLVEYSVERIVNDVWKVLTPFNNRAKSSVDVWSPNLVLLGIIASKFVENGAESKSISTFFTKSNAIAQEDVATCSKFSNDLVPNSDVVISDERKDNEIVGDDCNNEKLQPEVAKAAVDLSTSFFYKYQCETEKSIRAELEEEDVALSELGSSPFSIMTSQDLFAENFEIDDDDSEIPPAQPQTTINSANLYDENSRHSEDTIFDCEATSCDISIPEDEISDVQVQCSSSGAQQVDLTDVLPKRFEDIDPEILKSLPFSYRAELKSLYKTTLENKNTNKSMINPSRNVPMKKIKLTSSKVEPKSQSLTTFFTKSKW